VLQATAVPVSVIADTIVRTVELGVTITDAALDGDATVVFCELLDRGRQLCPGCGRVGAYRATVERRVTDVPVAGHPRQLRVRIRRYRCTADTCERVVFSADSSRLARPGATTTWRCARYVLRRLVLDRTTETVVHRVFSKVESPARSGVEVTERPWKVTVPPAAIAASPSFFRGKAGPSLLGPAGAAVSTAGLIRSSFRSGRWTD
jgi:hypothetical protein